MEAPAPVLALLAELVAPERTGYGFEPRFCSYCNELTSDEDWFHEQKWKHFPECPVVRARKLLSDQTQPAGS